MEVYYIHSFHGGIVTSRHHPTIHDWIQTEIFTFCRHSSLLLLVVARTQGGATVTSEDAWLLLDCGLGREGGELSSNKQ